MAAVNGLETLEERISALEKRTYSASSGKLNTSVSCYSS